jgi:hypothetical protein
MHQQAFDLLAIQNPGYTIRVSEASNKDLGLSAHVKRVNQGTLVSVRAEDPTTKTDEEKEALYLLVAAEGLKTQKEWYVSGNSRARARPRATAMPYRASGAWTMAHGAWAWA